MEKEKVREMRKAGKENGGYKIKLRSREAIKGRQKIEHKWKPAPWGFRVTSVGMVIRLRAGRPSKWGAITSTDKVKAVPLQAWSGPEGSRKLRFSRFHDNGTGWW